MRILTSFRIHKAGYRELASRCWQLVAFALCFAVLSRAFPARAQTNQVTNAPIAGAPSISVKAVIYPKTLADAIPETAAKIIPIAILSSQTFDSKKIDPDSLTLLAPRLNLMGRSSTARCQEKDVDGDGLEDLLCEFEFANVPVESGFAMSVLQGKTTDGIEVRADVPVNIVQDHFAEDPSGPLTGSEAPR